MTLNTYDGWSYKELQLMQVATGSKGIVANTARLTGNEGATLTDPTDKVRKRAEAKQAESDQAAADADRIEATAKADKMRATAKEASGAAIKSGTKKAHAVAAIAHTDAAAAYKALGGAKAGHDLQTRAKANTMADEHKRMAEQHKSLSVAGMSGAGGVLNTGSGGVMAKLGDEYEKALLAHIKFTMNMWSDAAREAAIAARRGKSDTTVDPRHLGIAETEAGAYHQQQASYHRGIAHTARTLGHAETAKNHQDAALAHGRAATSHERAGGDVDRKRLAEEASTKAEAASRTAEGTAGRRGTTPQSQQPRGRAAADHFKRMTNPDLSKRSAY